MGSTFEDCVFDFDLNFLRQPANNNVQVPSKLEKLKKALAITKKKIISTDALIGKYHEKKDSLEDFGRQLLASKDECKQICINYQDALERCLSLEKEIEKYRDRNHELEELSSTNYNRVAATQSYMRQLEDLLREHEATIDSLKVENNLGKSSTKDYEKTIAFFKRQRRDLLNKLNLAADVIFKKKTLNREQRRKLMKHVSKHTQILKEEIYEKADTDDDDDENTDTEITNDAPSENEDINIEKVYIDKIASKREINHELKTDLNDHDSDVSAVVSDDTGRASSVDTDKSFHSPDYFVNDSPLGLEIISNKEISTSYTPVRTYVDQSTSPINMRNVGKLNGDNDGNTCQQCQKRNIMVDKASSPVRKITVDQASSPIPECQDNGNRNKSMVNTVNRANSPIAVFVAAKKLSNKAISPMKLPKVVSKNCLVDGIEPLPVKGTSQSKAINHLFGDDSDNEIEMILKTMKITQKLISPLPATPGNLSASKYRNESNLHIVESKKVTSDSKNKANRKSARIVESDLSDLEEEEYEDSAMDTGHLEVAVNQTGEIGDPIDNQEKTIENIPIVSKSISERLLMFEEDVEYTEQNTPPVVEVEVLEDNDSNRKALSKGKKLTQLDKLRKNLQPKCKIRKAETPSKIKLRSSLRLYSDAKNVRKPNSKVSLNNKDAFQKAVKIMAELRSKRKNNMQDAKFDDNKLVEVNTQCKANKTESPSKKTIQTSPKLISETGQKTISIEEIAKKAIEKASNRTPEKRSKEKTNDKSHVNPDASVSNKEKTTEMNTKGQMVSPISSPKLKSPYMSPEPAVVLVTHELESLTENNKTSQTNGKDQNISSKKLLNFKTDDEVIPKRILRSSGQKRCSVDLINNEYNSPRPSLVSCTDEQIMQSKDNKKEINSRKLRSTRNNSSDKNADTKAQNNPRTLRSSMRKPSFGDTTESVNNESCKNDDVKAESSPRTLRSSMRKPSFEDSTENIMNEESCNTKARALRRSGQNLNDNRKKVIDNDNYIDADVHSDNSDKNKNSEIRKREMAVSYADMDIFGDGPSAKKMRKDNNTNRKLLNNIINPKDSFLCRMLEKYGTDTVNYQPKKNSDTVKKILKKIQEGISHIIELPAGESLKQIDNLVDVLGEYDQSEFLSGLMSYLMDPARKIELFNKKVNLHPAPSMTKSEQVLLYMVTKLISNWPDVIDRILNQIEYSLFKLNQSPDFDVIESMAHFYAILCRFVKSKSRLRLFIINAMYCLQFKAIPLIKQCIDVWMHVLPLAHMGIAKTPLVTCLVYLLHFFKCDDRFNRVQEIRDILKKKYFFTISEWNETQILEMFKTTIMELKDNAAEQKLLRLSLLILAKRHGPRWCQKKLIKNILQPVIANESTSEHAKAFCISMFGPLLKPYPSEMKVNCEVILNDILDILDTKRKYNPGSVPRNNSS